VEIIETNKEKNFSAVIFKSRWERFWRSKKARCPNCGSRKLFKDISFQNLKKTCLDCGHKIYEIIQK
jgi:uncharacterized protein (DUF983 family)